MQRKRCTWCGRLKNFAQFSIRYRDVLHSACKDCHNAYTRRWYRKRRLRQIALAGEARKRYNKLARALIAEVKSKPCADCKRKYPPHIMDLDHVTGTKVDAVSVMVRRKLSLERVKAEILKCEAVCSNCHRERTHRRRLASIP